MDSKLSMKNQNQLKRRREIQRTLTSRRKPKIHKFGHISASSFVACEELNWNRERSNAAQMWKTWDCRSELYNKSKNALRQRCFSLDFKKACGQKPWSCSCYLRNVQDLLADGQTLYERLGSIHQLYGPIIPFGAEGQLYPIPISSNDQGRVHQLGTKSPSWNIQWDTPWTREEVGQVVYLLNGGHGRICITDATMWNSRGRFKSKEVDIQKKRSANLYSHAGRAIFFCIRGLPLSQATQSENPNKILQKRKTGSLEMRESRCFQSSTRFQEHCGKNTQIGIMLLCEPSFMFRRTLYRYLWITLMSRDKRKRPLMHFTRHPSMILGILMLISVTRFDAMNRKSTRRTHVGSRQTDEETGYFNTWIHLARRMVINVEKRSAQSRESMGRRKTKMDAARAQRGTHFVPDKWSCVWGHRGTVQDAQWTSGEPQRCLAESPNQPTRTVQAGGDPVQVIGPKLKRKDWSLQIHRTIMRTKSLNRKEFEPQRVRITPTRTIARTEVTFLCRTTTFSDEKLWKTQHKIAVNRNWSK